MWPRDHIAEALYNAHQTVAFSFKCYYTHNFFISSFFSEKAVRDPTTTSPREKRFVVYSPRGGEIRGVSSSRIAALSSVYKKRIEKNVNIMKGREKRRRRIREDISFPKWEQQTTRVGFTCQPLRTWRMGSEGNKRPFSARSCRAIDLIKLFNAAPFSRWEKREKEKKRTWSLHCLVCAAGLFQTVTDMWDLFQQPGRHRLPSSIDWSLSDETFSPRPLKSLGANS